LAPEHLFFDRRAFRLPPVQLRSAFARRRRWQRNNPMCRTDEGPSIRRSATRNSPSIAAVTDEAITHLQYFYEFGSSKSLCRRAALRLRPWTVQNRRLVEKAQDVGIDDLVRRCRWKNGSTATAALRPGTGDPVDRLPLAKLVELAKPTSSAKYVRMETFLDKRWRPGSAQLVSVALYRGITMAEAMNDLASWSRAPMEAGCRSPRGPLRLALPWKYGFKSIKSITRVTFTDQRPKTFWEALQRPNTASGRTSIRRSPIRAGARRPCK